MKSELQAKKKILDKILYSLSLGKEYFLLEEFNMETKIAIIGIIINNLDSSEEINRVLHDYSDYIVGRMGIPYREKNLSVMSIVLDASTDIIGALTGKLGMIPEVSVKSVCSK